MMKVFIQLFIISSVCLHQTNVGLRGVADYYTQATGWQNTSCVLLFQLLSEVKDKKHCCRQLYYDLFKVFSKLPSTKYLRTQPALPMQGRQQAANQRADPVITLII